MEMKKNEAMSHEESTVPAAVQCVWMVSREYDGLAGAGGVKDVCRQLAETLVRHAGCRVRVILPRYGFMDPLALGFTAQALPGRAPSQAFDVDMNYAGEERRERISIWRQERRGVEIFLVEAERFAEKLGVYTYTAREQQLSAWQRQGTGHYDYFAMNVLLQKAALDLMLILDERPDIIHCQDGHTAILPAMARELAGYRHFFRHCGLVVTIHNAGLGYHQEVADLGFAAAITGLPRRLINNALLGRDFDPFVAAADHALLNTVSENYARELQESMDDSRTGWLGHLLLRRGVRIDGITNGIAPEDFNPRRGPELGLAAAFEPESGGLEGKRACKEALLVECAIEAGHGQVRRFGSLDPRPDLPLFTFIGRLTTQKGVDLLLGAVKSLAETDSDFQLLVLGSGESRFEEELEGLAKGLARRICFLNGYDQHLALRVYAGGDFFLIPSRYEPCGLTDYMAQLLGNIPIVRNVGGLVKVLDNETGLHCLEHSEAALAATMTRALELFRHDQERLRTMQARAVTRIYEHHTWKRVMDLYLRLYVRAIELTGKAP